MLNAIKEATRTLYRSYRFDATVQPGFLYGTPGLSQYSTPGNPSLNFSTELSVTVIGTSNVVGSGNTILAGRSLDWTFQKSINNSLVLVIYNDGVTPIIRSSTAVAADDATGYRAVWTAAEGVVRFYVRNTIGVWSQLGLDVALVTPSIFTPAPNPLIIQTVNANSQIYSIEVIGDGVLRANPDFSAVPANTTSFVDGVGNVWTLTGSFFRIVGETFTEQVVQALPPDLNRTYLRLSSEKPFLIHSERFSVLDRLNNAEAFLVDQGFIELYDYTGAVWLSSSDSPTIVSGMVITE